MDFILLTGEPELIVSYVKPYVVMCEARYILDIDGSDDSVAMLTYFIELTEKFINDLMEMYPDHSNEFKVINEYMRSHAITMLKSDTHLGRLIELHAYYQGAKQCRDIETDLLHEPVTQINEEAVRNEMYAEYEFLKDDNIADEIIGML